MAANDDDVGTETLRRLHYHVHGGAGRHVKAWRGRRSGHGDMGHKAFKLCLRVACEIESGMTCPFRKEGLLRVKYMECGAGLTGKSGCEQKCSVR